MDRRTLLLSLLALPLTRPASSADPRRLGFISTSTTSQDSPFLMALRKGLQERGYEEGKSAPRRRVSPMEEDSIQRVVG
jgi:hypothetical protein